MGEITDPLLKQSPSGRRRSPGGIIVTLDGDAHGPSNANLVSSISPAVGGPNIPLGDFGQGTDGRRKLVQIADDSAAEDVFADYGAYDYVIQSGADLERASTTPAPALTLRPGRYAAINSLNLSDDWVLGVSTGGVQIDGRNGVFWTRDNSTAGALFAVSALGNLEVNSIAFQIPADGTGIIAATGGSFALFRCILIGGGGGVGTAVAMSGDTGGDLTKCAVTNWGAGIAHASSGQLVLSSVGISNISGGAGLLSTGALQADQVTSSVVDAGSSALVTSGGGVLRNSSFIQATGGEICAQLNGGTRLQIDDCEFQAPNTNNVTIGGAIGRLLMNRCGFNAGTGTGLLHAVGVVGRAELVGLYGTAAIGVDWDNGNLPADGLVEEWHVWSATGFANHGTGDALVMRRACRDVSGYLSETAIVP